MDDHEINSKIHINGIENRTGCTCYIGSAIQLIFHCIPKLRFTIISTLESSNEEYSWRQDTTDVAFLQELSTLFLSLTKKIAIDKVDPTKFYETLRDWNDSPLNLYELGDAASILSLVLSRIFKVANDCNVALESLCDELEGSTVQTITGDFYQKNKCVKHRIKVKSPRFFRGLFPVDVIGHKSLLDALAASTIRPQIIERYIWLAENDEQNVDGTWITHRKNQFHDLPLNFMVQLKRFTFDGGCQSNDKQVIKHLDELVVPLTLDLGPFIADDCKPSDRQHMYLLRGVIAHAGRNANDGHYLTIVHECALMNRGGDNYEAKHWIVLDDEYVSKIQTSELFRFINGGDSALFYEDDEEMPLCAMVLLYSRSVTDEADDGLCFAPVTNATDDTNTYISSANISLFEKKLARFIQKYTFGDYDVAEDGLEVHERNMLMASFQLFDEDVSVQDASDLARQLGLILFRILIPKREWRLVTETCRVLLHNIGHDTTSISTTTPWSDLIYTINIVLKVPSWELFANLANDTAAQRCIERFFFSCLHFSAAGIECEDAATCSALVQASWDLLSAFLNGVFHLLRNQSSCSSAVTKCAVHLGCRIVANGVCSAESSQTLVYNGSVVQNVVTKVFHLMLHPSLDIYLESDTLSATILNLLVNAFLIEARCLPTAPSFGIRLMTGTGSKGRDDAELVNFAERFFVFLSKSGTKRQAMKSVSYLERNVYESLQSFWVTKAILNLLTSVDSSHSQRLEEMELTYKKQNKLPPIYKALLALSDVQDSRRWERIELIFFSLFLKDPFSEITDTHLIFIWRLTKRCYRLGLSSTYFSLLQEPVKKILIRLKINSSAQEPGSSSQRNHLAGWYTCPAPTEREMVAQRLEEYLLRCASKNNVEGEFGCTATNGMYFYTDYDSDDYPEDLVNLRIAVQWADGNMYSGQIISYDEVSRKHRVIYDDGDEKRYRLLRKTWTLEGDFKLC